MRLAQQAAIEQHGPASSLGVGHVNTRLGVVAAVALGRGVEAVGCEVRGHKPVRPKHAETSREGWGGEGRESIDSV